MSGLPRLGALAPAGVAANHAADAHHLELTPFRSKDGLAAAYSDEHHLNNTRDREYGVQARRRGCMTYLQHQGQQQRPLIAPPQGQSNEQRPGKKGGLVVLPSAVGVCRCRQPVHTCSAGLCRSLHSRHTCRCQLHCTSTPFSK